VFSKGCKKSTFHFQISIYITECEIRSPISTFMLNTLTLKKTKTKKTNKQTKTKIHLDFVASRCGSPPLVCSDVFRKQIPYEGALEIKGNMLKHRKSIYMK